MKIKLLVMSDIHAQFSKFKVDAMPDAEVCIVAGDITNLGKIREWEVNHAKEWFKQLSEKYPMTLYILGNHDLLIPNKYFELKNVYSIEKEVFNYKGFSFSGVNMSPCYDAPRMSMTWRNMTSDWKVEYEAYSNLESVDILVSHCPPKGILCHNLDWGSQYLLDYINKSQPELVVCGHIHEATGTDKVGKTTIVNTACKYELIELEKQNTLYDLCLKQERFTNYFKGT